MDQTLPLRLPAHLEAAVQRVRMAARAAAEHTVDSLGLAALASTSVLQRDALLGAQYELNRKLAIFALTFNEALDTDVARQTGALTPTPSPAVTPESLISDWDKLSLVDDHEVEIHISADRFSLEIAHACEWEIRELDAYMGSLLGLSAADHDRNPLRAEVVARAMMRAVDAMSDRPEVRKVLATEIGRSLAQAMRQTYADIVADLRISGLKPMGLAVRQTASRSGAFSGHGALAEDTAHGHEPSVAGRLSTRSGAPASGSPGLRSGYGPALGAHGGLHAGGASLGRVDAPMMSLIRRLAQGHGVASGADMPSGSGSYGGQAGVRGLGGGGHGGYGSHGVDAMGGLLPAGAETLSLDGLPMAAPNLILTYRDELRQAATGALDHMVIDVIAGLFDQILSDGKVPPQMARQIARLQLPVLRAALGDHAFFSSRRHPVRRFINRIASLGTAVDDFDGPQGRALLERVAALVQDVVDGDFDQIEVYEKKLQALEAFIAAQAQAEVQALGNPDAVLARKEGELQAQAHFSQKLGDALAGLPVPDFLREFLAQTWSRAIASAEQQHGKDSAHAQRMREVGRELVMSVQPKGTPAQRQLFLRTLPQLMKDINAGLDRLRCAEELRRDFFSKLLPAHADALRLQPLSTLEHNLLARRVDGALATPLPAAAELPPMSPAAAKALQATPLEPSFTPDEARAVGLVDEATVNWQGDVDIDLDAPAEPEIAAVDIALDGLPAPEAPEPTRGKSLADHVQLGFAYQMHLDGEWRKVKLTHVSPGRSFFVFTHGSKQRQTVSLTQRMLHKMCEAGRLRAFENAYLLERATARARRQLASLTSGR